MDAADETEFLTRVRRSLEGRVIGRNSDLGTSVAELKPAAVLVPLFEERGEPHVLLVRRSDQLGQHAGQFAFPGGRREEGEDDLGCAVRETREEIGLAADALELLGQLDRYHTVTDFLVAPFVAKLRWPVPLTPDPSEVASILTVRVAQLAARGALREYQRETPSGPKPVSFFVTGEDVIWGATAAMLRQLLELALGRGLVPEGEVPWDKVRF